MAFALKFPAARTRLINVLGELLMFAPLDHIARVCEQLQHVAGPEERDKLLLAMALNGLVAPPEFQNRQTEVQAEHTARNARQRAGIAAAKERKTAEATKKTPPNDDGEDGALPASAPPAPKLDPLSGGGTIAVERVEPSLDDQHDVAGERDVLDISYDPILAPSYPRARGEVPVPVIVTSEPSPAIHARRESVATGDLRDGIAASKDRKSAEAQKESPPDDAEGGSLATPPPPDPNSGPIGGGAAVAIEATKQDLTKQKLIAGDAVVASDDAVYAPHLHSSFTQVPASATANPEPTQALPPQSLVAAAVDRYDAVAATGGNRLPVAATPARASTEHHRGEKPHGPLGTLEGRPLAQHGNVGSSTTVRPPPAEPRVHLNVPSRSHSPFPPQHLGNQKD
ncbi:MAG: hypothetical protein WDN02_16835 [Methylovirgula sp.]|uniref:hypothetical protein n=1 Tax=Methylovirgula sp. TaxID=1978224 RepID=UPI0030761CF2